MVEKMIMLDTCIHYASSHSLIFNASKTQLIRFSRSDSFCMNSTIHFSFLGQRLCFSKSVIHLGHILTNDLSDREDIASIKTDLCKKANCLLHIFSSCNPDLKTKLFRSFCLSLYGSALWNASSSELHHLEVTCNNILRIRSGHYHGGVIPQSFISLLTLGAYSTVQFYVQTGSLLLPLNLRHAY